MNLQPNYNNQREAFSISQESSNLLDVTRKDSCDSWGNILYKYNGQFATNANRTLEMDSEWSKERAKFITDQYFEGSTSVQSLSRYGLPSNAISGLNLNSFGQDAVGITIGIKFHLKKPKRPNKHGTVLYL